MKVLLVEDELKLARALEKGLCAEGFVVDKAVDGLRGLEMALTCHHDVMILDVMLPYLNGFEVLSRVRQQRCKVPVILLTARNSLSDRVKGLDLGADDYLPKPFEFPELLARIRAVTRRPASEPQLILRFADLELNLGSRELRRDGHLIPLRAKEYALMELFMRRKGLVLSRSMILNHVWASDMDYGDASNLVDVYVGQLRKKIDSGRDQKLLHTLRGAGYVLREPS
ncbi:response regulator transcription factor [Geothrix paludis]|uniref:response regulator n=1 Tax=Geothrix paludis TaxID=2922722 RepID=UPI001FAC0E1C|nr:response regulator transcription factor [Geothrix paludis]